MTEAPFACYICFHFVLQNISPITDSGCVSLYNSPDSTTRKDLLPVDRIVPYDIESPVSISKDGHYSAARDLQESFLKSDSVPTDHEFSFSSCDVFSVKDAQVVDYCCQPVECDICQGVSDVSWSHNHDSADNVSGGSIRLSQHYQHINNTSVNASHDSTYV